MTSFVLAAAVMVLVAVAFAVAVLWKGSRGLALAIAVGLPLAAAGLYAWKGTPAALAPGATDPVAAPTPAESAEIASAQAQVDAAFAELDARIAKDANDWEAWAIKGRMYLELQQFDAARDALAKAHALAPGNDGIAVGYAETLMRTSPDRRFPPEAVALIERAARANPPDERAVFFLGMHKALNGAPGEAADLWESILPRLDPRAAAALRPQIAAAREAAARMGGAPVPAPVVASGPSLEVVVGVDPALAARATPGSVLYVFARRPGAGGPPIAVERVVVARWPVVVTLTDADSPMPTAALSSAPQVVVTARLAHAGDAMASSGDLESDSATAAPADGKRVALMLAKVRP